MIVAIMISSAPVRRASAAPRLHAGRAADDVGGEDLGDELLLGERPRAWRPGFDLVVREQLTCGAGHIPHRADTRGVVVAFRECVGGGTDNSH
jgi:hypothetical protein